MSSKPIATHGPITTRASRLSFGEIKSDHFSFWIKFLVDKNQASILLRFWVIIKKPVIPSSYIKLSSS